MLVHKPYQGTSGALHGYLQNKRSDNHGEQRPSTEESYHLLTPPPHFLPSPQPSLIPSLPSLHPSPASSWVWCQWGVWQALITVPWGGDSGDRWVCPSLTPGVGVSDQAVRPPPVSDTGLSHTMSLNPSNCLPLCSVHAPLWVWSQYKGGCWCVEMFWGDPSIHTDVPFVLTSVYSSISMALHFHICITHSIQKDMISVKIQNANGAFLYVAQRYSVIHQTIQNNYVFCFCFSKHGPPATIITNRLDDASQWSPLPLS